MNKIEIINDTRAFYSVDSIKRRAIDEMGVSSYRNGSKKCAVGRYVENGSGFQFNSQCSVKYFTDLDRYLKPEFRNHEIEFWNRLQKFHDTDEYWWEYGITLEGEKYLNSLKVLYTPNIEIGEITTSPF